MVANSELRTREGERYGGSADGIRRHYDLDSDFWSLMLGPTMAYSCALFERPDEDLDQAQRRKLRWHFERAGAESARATLDVGCGWGSMLREFAAAPHIERVVGLTLSEAQAAHGRAAGWRSVEVRVENWASHTPQGVYDSIVSIGAFEHFANHEETPEEKVSVYRDFFERCRAWLSPSGRMTLQTICYGEMTRDQANDFLAEVFPDSDLPTLGEIVAGLEGHFEIVSLQNDRLHYATTTDRWVQNLRRHHAQAAARIGEAKVAELQRYLKLSSMGFRMGKLRLLRLALRPVTNRWGLVGS